VRVTSASYQQVLSTSRYSGEVKVRHEPMLAFQVPGKLIKRLVDVGSTVQPGQALATLDPPDYRLNQAGAAAQLEAAQAELAQARKDLQHAANLLAKELASQAYYDRRRDAVRTAEAHVARARAELKIDARKSAYTELLAEHAGVITRVEAEVGQVVSAGQPIFYLARTDEKEVVINVPENHLDDLRQATAITVSLWAKPGVLYPAKVREISPEADATLRTFTVKVAMLEASEDVRLGMTATVHVQRADPQLAAWLPLTALTQIDGRSSVWVVNPGDHKVYPHAVEFKGINDESAKITTGIKDGDLVVTAGVHKLLPGEKVRILAEDAR
jgi:multidrug efflux system membrane fusion protein